MVGGGGLWAGLGGLLGGCGGGVFGLGGWGVILSRTGESAKQAEELEVREEEEEESVEDSEEGSEDSPGSLLLFWGGGGLEGALGFGLVFVLFWGPQVCFAREVGVCFGLGGRFWDQDGGLGGAHELLAVSGGRGHVVNAAPALHLRLQDATTAGQMVSHGRQHLQGCN